MARKIQKDLPIHRECKHCCLVEHEFLNYEGKPIMGECRYSEKRFLLNEKIDCKEYK